MSHTYSTPTTATYAVTFDTLDQMMSVFPNNNNNEISARDVRDAVLTLYWQTQELGASFSATASQFLYTNSEPTTVPVGGITAGTTFSNRTLNEIFNDMLYPYIGPSSSLTVTDSTREFGRSNSAVLTWNAIKAKLPITSITVNGQSKVPTGLNQTGTQSATVTQNVNTTFSMSVSDDTSTVLSSATVMWLNAVYWGTTPTFALPSMSITPPASKPSWANGAGVGSGKNLQNNRSANYSGIDGAGQFLVFAWPTTYGQPTFTINGVPNTAFTKIGTSVNFTNMFGYLNQYDVWISNTAQNSPITSFIIS